MAAYGAVLGAGIFTPYAAATMYAVVALSVALADPWSAAAVFATYGGLRAASSITATVFALAIGINPVAQKLQRAKLAWRPILGALAIAASFLSVIAH
jgi:hypothetical protein